MGKALSSAFGSAFQRIRNVVMTAQLGAWCDLAGTGLRPKAGSPTPPSCVIHVSHAAPAGIWFVMQHFWFLDIMVSGTHLHLLCKLALAALLPALMVPGLVYARAPPMAVGTLLVLQVGLVATTWSLNCKFMHVQSMPGDGAENQAGLCASKRPSHGGAELTAEPSSLGNPGSTRTMMHVPDGSIGGGGMCQLFPAPAPTLVSAQASLVCVLEEKLFAGSHANMAAESMYPGCAHGFCHKVIHTLISSPNCRGAAYLSALQNAYTCKMPPCWSVHSLPICMISHTAVHVQL